MKVQCGYFSKVESLLAKQDATGSIPVIRSRKLTLLLVSPRTLSCHVAEPIFLWVDYKEGKLDKENAYEEVERVRPGWHPFLDCVS